MSANRKCTTLRAVRTARFGPSAWICSAVRPMLARRGMATYSVLSETPKAAERRGEPRRPVHLQSGKILAYKDRFLTEFTFKNRTQAGMRLKLARRVALPRSVFLYDDQRSELLVARVVWQNNGDAGCRIHGKPIRLDDRLLARLKGPYYAVH